MIDDATRWPVYRPMSQQSVTLSVCSVNHQPICGHSNCPPHYWQLAFAPREHRKQPSRCTYVSFFFFSSSTRFFSFCSYCFTVLLLLRSVKKKVQEGISHLWWTKESQTSCVAPCWDLLGVQYTAASLFTAECCNVCLSTPKYVLRIQPQGSKMFSYFFFWSCTLFFFFSLKWSWVESLGCKGVFFQAIQ